MAKVNFDTSRRLDFVLPSGVECSVLSLKGFHQKIITRENEKKRVRGFLQIFEDLVVKVGNRTHDIDKDFVKSLLSEDVKKILMNIRAVSTKHDPLFKFTYEFPMQNGQKREQYCEVDLNNQNFKFKPYQWVEEKIKADFLEKNNREINIDELQEIYDNGELPVCYETYESMLAAETKRTTKLTECGAKVTWSILSHEFEQRKGQLQNREASINDFIENRKPVYETEIELSDGSKKDEIVQLPVDKLDFLDIEDLRKDMFKQEAEVGTQIVIQYDKDPNTIARIDLMQTPAFFFPSMAT